MAGRGRPRKEYDLTPELKHKIKVINQRLYNLEKSDYTRSSAAYRTMSQYAVGRDHNLYNYNYDDYSLRLKSSNKDWESLSTEERKKLTEIVENIWENPESTTQINAIKAAFDKAFEKFNENFKQERQITKEQYKQVWETYADLMKEGRYEFLGSDKVMQLLQDQDLNIGMMLDESTFEEALRIVSEKEKVRLSPEDYERLGRRTNNWRR